MNMFYFILTSYFEQNYEIKTYIIYYLLNSLVKCFRACAKFRIRILRIPVIVQYS